MPRSGNAVFIHDKETSKTTFCSSCEEKRGRIVKLIPRILEDGLIDDKFKLCPNCTQLIPIHEAILDTQYEPKGSIIDNPYESGVKVSVIRNKRTMRKSPKGNIEPYDIPKFMGKDDVELERLVTERPALINYIHDVVVEGEDM